MIVLSILMEIIVVLGKIFKSTKKKTIKKESCETIETIGSVSKSNEEISIEEKNRKAFRKSPLEKKSIRPISLTILNKLKPLHNKYKKVDTDSHRGSIPTRVTLSSSRHLGLPSPKPRLTLISSRIKAKLAEKKILQSGDKPQLS